MKESIDEHYMNLALKQAEKAAAIGEVPIGCVIVHDGKIVGRGYNRRNHNKTTLAHAELTAIDRASRKLGDWRLEGCTLYVTLEPCQMCSGAIVQARIDRVVIGAMNPKAGCAGSILNLLQMKEFNHQVETTRGVCEEACQLILKSFFKELRLRVKREKEERWLAEVRDREKLPENRSEKEHRDNFAQKNAPGEKALGGETPSEESALDAGTMASPGENT